jgi:septal ring factor EnvC (AmiA/AmiB activator)
MTSETPGTTAPRNILQVLSLVANAIFAIAVAAFAFLYFQANRDLDGQKASVAALQTELAGQKASVAAVQTELAKEAARAAELKSDLNSVRTTAQSLADKSAQLQSDILSKEQALAQEKSRAESAQTALEREKARPPAVPIRVEMRRSAMGGGLVAMLSNTSARQLPLLVATQNPTTRATKRFTRQVAPGRKIELGHQEGWAFASGDRVLLRSAGFEDLQYTVP